MSETLEAVSIEAKARTNSEFSKSTGDDKLRSFVERIVRLEQERQALSDDIKDIKTEAKDSGYNVKALTVIVKRKMETIKQRETREELESIVEIMKAALGEFIDTPLGAETMRRTRQQ